MGWSSHASVTGSLAQVFGQTGANNPKTVGKWGERAPTPQFLAFPLLLESDLAQAQV